jgi:hypothetical protein
MLFRATHRDMLTIVGALGAYTLVVGALGAARVAERRRQARVRRWMGVFRGEASEPKLSSVHATGARRAA